MPKWRWEDYKNDLPELMNLQVKEYRIIEGEFFHKAAADLLKSERHICVLSNTSILWKALLVASSTLNGFIKLVP